MFDIEAFRRLYPLPVLTEEARRKPDPPGTEVRPLNLRRLRQGGGAAQAGQGGGFAATLPIP